MRLNGDRLGADPITDTTFVVQSEGLKDLFALRDHAKGESIELNSLLKGPAGQQLAQLTLEAFKKNTAIEFPSATAGLILDRPELLTNHLKVGLKQLHMARQLYLATNGREHKPVDRGYQLPNKFDFKHWNSVPIQIPVSELVEITPDIMRGYPRNSQISNERIRSSFILAETLDRLAVNTGKPNDPFVVIYKGKELKDPCSLLSTLQNDGYKIKSHIESRVADFVGLHAHDAHSGELKPVPLPGFVSTGIANDRGEEAILPMLHSEVIIEFSSSEKSQLSGSVKWYQGTDGTGFFPANCEARPSWVGENIHDCFGPEDTCTVLELAACYTKVLRKTARFLNLPVDGYGITGVCNDSVAMIQAAMGRPITLYPLFMMNPFVVEGIRREFENTKGNERVVLKRLLEASKNIPTDYQGGHPSIGRMLSLPWDPGAEVFHSTCRARKILMRA